MCSRVFLGLYQLDYPNDKEVMDRFDCEDTVSFSYHSAHFALLSRALNQSIKICLQVESTGFLCIQIMMPVGEGVPMGQHSGILEFKVSYNLNWVPQLMIDARVGRRRLIHGLAAGERGM